VIREGLDALKERNGPAQGLFGVNVPVGGKALLDQDDLPLQAAAALDLLEKPGCSSGMPLWARAACRSVSLDAGAGSFFEGDTPFFPFVLLPAGFRFFAGPALFFFSSGIPVSSMSGHKKTPPEFPPTGLLRSSSNQFI
jgi:hypothetical protein